MRRILALSVLLLGIGCGEPPKVLETPKTYVGIWRTGSSKADYQVLQIFQDKSVSLFGTKHDLIAPADIEGDSMTIKADKATPTGAEAPAGPAKFTVQLKRVSDTSIEVTDSTGILFGVATPVKFEKISSSEQDDTNAAIMQRAMNGG